MNNHLRRLSLLICILTILVPLSGGRRTYAFEAATTSSAAWLLNYRGKSTNDVRWADQFPALLSASLPHISAPFSPKERLSAAALEYLSGNPEQVRIESNRFVTLAAMHPADGWDRGLIWVNVFGSNSPVIFAALHVDPAHSNKAKLELFTNSEAVIAKLPPQFLSSLASWLSTNKISTITEFSMTGKSGQARQLQPALLGSL